MRSIKPARASRTWILVTAVLLAAAIMPPLPAGAQTLARSAISCPACGHNLILNPGAEAGAGTSNDSVVTVPDWQGTGGFTAAQYAWSGGDLSATSSGPADRGNNYFYGGPQAAVSTGTQMVTLQAGGISTGKIFYTLSGWLGGYAGQEDSATLSATFQDSGGKALAVATIGPVSAADRTGVAELLFRQASGSVPAGTQQVSLELQMQRQGGSDNDGLADNLSLVFSTSAPTGSGGTTGTAGSGSGAGPTGGEPATGSSGLQFSPATVAVPASVVAATLQSVSADGAVYTFSSAKGPLAKLKAGSVMFLAGTAVRLVTKVASSLSGLVVTTSPAAITDLVSNGTLDWDEPVDFGNASAIQGPGVPDETAALPAPSGSLGASLRPSVLEPRGASHSSLGIGGKGVTLKGKAGPYSFSMSVKQVGRALSVSITLSKSSPVEVSATAAGTIQNFTTDGAVSVAHGKTQAGKLDMQGLSGQFTLSYELKPLTAFGLGAAGGFKLTIPGEITVPFAIPTPLGPLPMFVGVKVAFYVSVGFSNKNQSIKGSYTVNYDGNAGFSISKTGATTGSGVIKGIGQVILDQANAIMNGPISLVLGAQIPQLEVGLGTKGLNVAGFVDLVADTAIKVGGGFGGSTGCDARDLKVLATAGAKASFFGMSADLGSTTLFSKDFIASYPPACGTL